MNESPRKTADPGRWILLGCAAVGIVAAASWASWRLQLQRRASAKADALLRADPAVPRLFGALLFVRDFSSWRMTLGNVLSFRTCRVQFTVWGAQRSSALTLTFEGSDLHVADARVWDGALESGEPLVLESP